MRIGLIKTRTLIHALAISVFLFNGHKIAGRFGSAPKENMPEWAREFPGLIINHQPFESMGIATAAIAFYLLTTGICFYLGVKILTTSKYRKYIPWFFAFIFAWGVHEVHHMFSAYPNGKIFAFWFSVSALIVLPAMLTWNGLIVVLTKAVLLKTNMKEYIGKVIRDRGVTCSRVIANNSGAGSQRTGIPKIANNNVYGSPEPVFKPRFFYRLEYHS